MGLAALIVGAGIGGGTIAGYAESASVQPLRANITTLEEQNAALMSEISTLEKDLAEVTEKRDALLVAYAEVAEERDLEKGKRREAERAARDAEDAVADKTAELEKREAEVAERETAIGLAEDRIAETTIREGTWSVGRDIEAGTYTTAEPVSSGACYWGIYRGGSNQEDIISNDIVTGGRPTVTLRDGQDFTTQRCGSWIQQ